MPLTAAVRAVARSDDKYDLNKREPARLTATQINDNTTRITRIAGLGQQQGLDGAFAFGDLLGGPETATTLRTRGGAVGLTDRPFLGIEDFIAGIDVVACADRRQAIGYAATHPMARDHAIEVRPFYSA